MRRWTIIGAVVAGGLAVLAAPATALLSGEVGGATDSEGHAELEVTPPELPGGDAPELPEAPEFPALPEAPALPALPEAPEGDPPAVPEIPLPAPDDGGGVPEVPEIPIPVPDDGGGSGLPAPLPVPGEGGLPVPVPEIPAGPGTGEVGLDVEVGIEAGTTPPPANGGKGDGGGKDGKDGTKVEVDLRGDLEATTPGGGLPEVPELDGGGLPELPTDGTPAEALDPALLLLLLENPELATNPDVLAAALGETPAGDVLAESPVPAEDLTDDAMLASLTSSLPELPAGDAAPLAGTGLAGLGAFGLFSLKRRFLG
jgi:hypothetical protein